MKKKAIGYNIVEYYIIRIPYLILLIGIFLYVTGSLERQGLSSHNTRQQIIINRIFYSPNSITYTDSATGRSYPNVVDLSRFKDEAVLDKAFFTMQSRVLAASLQLTNLDTAEVYQAYINQDAYDRWKSYTKFEQYENFIDKRYVLIRNGDTLQKGVIKISLVIPNE
ncbi:MAG: hypothetical protein HGA85_07990 [Nanoarchaeota archaeon]|nr:hypothetical protein [Nanoarchaeota archaeon]